ncbi:helix-turn-helix domain-containing protein [Streptomyces sp. NPDC002701]|uniref:helix-turn-helix domain-containing protein n=1 Tax=Streptomyces sp. NPDC002701 TaxID=3364661 RepID=UPI0036C34CB8
MSAADPPLRDVNPVESALGSRLRELRHRGGLSLAALSGLTGISSSVLSRLESGGRLPTLRHLLSLARAHQISLDDLIGAGDGEPTMRLPVITRRGMTLVRLSDRPGGLQAYRILVPVSEPGDDMPVERQRGHGSAAEVPRLHVHEGRNWLCVLSGRLRLVLGTHELVLTAGEVAEYDARAPHWYGAAGPDPAEILAVFGVQSEGLRLRIRAAPSARE